MNPAPDLHPDVLPTGDGERSTAGSNYGDWRPLRPPAPHGYDFEKRFVRPALDPDFRTPQTHEHAPAAPDPDALPD